MRTQSNVSSRLVDDLRIELEQSGIDVYRGYGQFLDARTIQIADPSGTSKTIVADNTIVATGSRARFANKSAPRLVNSDQLLRIQSWPERLVIIGAGYTSDANLPRSIGRWAVR
jgi:pyruvate/2-oxoglutarate dehydrogenase complex dihydrolipoamide dehydrogenase (E3) component